MLNNYDSNRNEINFIKIKPITNDNFIRKHSNGLLGSRQSHSQSALTRDSLHQHIVANEFYKNIAPMRWFLTAIGVMPITRTGPKNAKVIIGSLAFAYSLLFFTIFMVYVGFVIQKRIRIVATLSGPFEEAVIAYLFLLNLIPVFLIPIMWRESRKLCNLLNAWDELEVLYYKVTGSMLTLKLRRRIITIVIVLPLLSILSVVINHITMSEFSLVQIIPYCILDTLTTLLGAWWYFICEALSVTANNLAERFQKALRHIGPAAMIADYRSLWLSISKLTRDTGTATCFTFTFLNLYLFFLITLTVYGLMSQLSSGFGIKDIGLAITALWGLSLLFFVCDQGHYASFNVCTNFQKKLLMVELNWMNSDAQTEINMFLRATEMNPSHINYGGFFDVNRSLFKGLLTTMVTYLVVLLQFQISIPTDKGENDQQFNTNVTLSNEEFTTSLGLL